MRPIRILALDGGGSWDLLVSRLLQRLERQRPGFLQSVDIFAGTSAGGILALLLAAYENPADALELAVASHEIYSPTDVSACHKLQALAGSVPIIGNEKILEFTDAVFGDRLLGELPHQVVVPAFCVNGVFQGRRSWQPRIFHNIAGVGDLSVKAADLARRTTASPLAMPIYQDFVDGGVFAENPSMAAISATLAVHQQVLRETDVLPRVQMLSLGLGYIGTYLEVGDGEWGWRKWIIDPDQPFAIVELLFMANMMAITQQAQQLLGNQYFRLAPNLYEAMSRQTSTDQTDQMLTAIAARTDLEPVLGWIDEFGWAGARDVTRAAS